MNKKANPFPLKKRAELELFRVYRSIQTKMHELNYLFWECTLRCNISCKHCGSDCRHDSATPDMPMEDFLKVLDQVSKEYNPNKVMVAITGGEPLLRKDLEECGRQIYNRGFPWGMVTNGLLLTKEKLDSLCKSGLRSITVSIDGMKESHNWLRGNDQSYVNAIKAVEYCADKHNIVSDVVTCVNKRNLPELEEIRNDLIANGVKKWRLFTIFPKGRAREIKDLELSPSEFRQLLDFIVICRKNRIIEASYGCEGFLGEYEGLARNGFFFCRAGVTVASVLADGSISACPSLRGDFIQGNIYKDDFLDCWNNRYEKMRNRKWARTDKCAECKEFRYCNGNGLHLREGPESGLVMCHYEKINGVLDQ